MHKQSKCLHLAVAALILAFHHESQVASEVVLTTAQPTVQDEVNEPAATDSHELDDGPPAVYYLHATSEIQSRFATTLICSKLANRFNASRQATFNVQLPNSAFISNFSMEIAGDIIVGQVKEKQQAKADYETARRRGQSAGHVAHKPARETNVFKISVNVAAFSKVTFNLTYQEVLQRVHGVYKHVINLQPEQVVKDLKVSVMITENGEIRSLKVPKFGPGIADKTNQDLLQTEDDISAQINSAITRDLSQVQISFSPSAAQKQSLATSGGQLVVLYDVARDNDAGEIQVVNGYFVHFFAPSGITAGSKHVVFVLDKSGSMYDQKIAQTKEAMRTILSELKPADYFNILTFSEDVAAWKLESVAATESNIEEAKAFVTAIQAEGGTNIDAALNKGLQQLSTMRRNSIAAFLVFLTDGQPTVGESEPNKILENIRTRNAERSHGIHCVGFGNDADYELLKRISHQNAGIARKVYEDSDAALQLQGFYGEISNPLLAKLKITYLNESVLPSSLVHDQNYNYYEGGEYVVAGKLASESLETLNVEISAASSEGPVDFALAYEIPQSLSVSGERLPGQVSSTSGGNAVGEMQALRAHKLSPADSIGGFVERTWAYLTIKELLNRAKYSNINESASARLKEQALQLSLKYSFVTELTSMVVVVPEKNQTEAQDSAAHETKLEDATDNGNAVNRPNSPVGMYAMSASSHRLMPSPYQHFPSARSYGLSADMHSYKAHRGPASMSHHYRAAAAASSEEEDAVPESMDDEYAAPQNELDADVGCGQNETLASCGSQCEQKCEAISGGNKTACSNQQQCSAPTCICKPGYARLLEVQSEPSSCVLQNDCPIKQAAAVENEEDEGKCSPCADNEFFATNAQTGCSYCQSEQLRTSCPSSNATCYGCSEATDFNGCPNCFCQKDDALRIRSFQVKYGSGTVSVCYDVSVKKGDKIILGKLPSKHFEIHGGISSLDTKTLRVPYLSQIILKHRNSIISLNADEAQPDEAATSSSTSKAASNQSLDGTQSERNSDSDSTVAVTEEQVEFADLSALKMDFSKWNFKYCACSDPVKAFGFDAAVLAAKLASRAGNDELKHAGLLGVLYELSQKAELLSDDVDVSGEQDDEGEDPINSANQKTLPATAELVFRHLNVSAPNTVHEERVITKVHWNAKSACYVVPSRIQDLLFQLEGFVLRI